MIHTLLLFAEDAPKAATPTAPPGGGFEMILFLMVPLVLMYLIVLRPGQKRQEQERNSLLSGLAKNDRVLTTAGIYAVVVAVSEPPRDEVTVRVDEGVHLKVVKSSIARNLTKEEAASEAKAAKAGKKEGAA